MPETYVNARVNTVVIGGGQAGLSVGYHLSQLGLPFVILDASRRVGDNWRHTLGLAAAVHAGAACGSRRHAVSRRAIFVSDERRDGRLSRRPTRGTSSCRSDRRPRRPALTPRRSLYRRFVGTSTASRPSNVVVSDGQLSAASAVPSFA